MDEDELAESFGAQDLTGDSRIGSFREIYAARVCSPEFVQGSSSGGITSHLLSRMLEDGLVDGVIHVGGPSDSGLFEYTASYTLEEISMRRKSAYYSTSFAEILRDVRGDGKRYAFVGVPCFVKAAKLLCIEDAQLKSQISFFVGLLCGHLKSRSFAELLAWQIGAPPDELSAVDFRVKVPGRRADDYDFVAQDQGGARYQAPTRALLGGDWGHAMFQLAACNYCDDIFAETADIALGDAWLPEYQNEWLGTNLVVTRDERLAQLLAVESSAGRIVTMPLSREQAVRSQAGSFRHRRVGLALRLHDDQVSGRWAPRKRVEPSSTVSRRRRRIIRTRRALSEASHEAFAQAREANSLPVFLNSVGPVLRQYELAAQPSRPRLMAHSLIRELRRVRDSVRRRLSVR